MFKRKLAPRYSSAQTIKNFNKANLHIMIYRFILVLFFLLEAPLFIYSQSDNILPHILTRDSWLKDKQELFSDFVDYYSGFMSDKEKKSDVLFKKPEMIILHNLGCGLNCVNDEKDARSIIYNTYLFDKNIKGYNDLEYDFIIDKSGNIYQGRISQNGLVEMGNYDNTSCLDYNYGSINIALITSAEKDGNILSLLQYDSLKKLVGFLAYANSLTKESSFYVAQDKKENDSCVRNLRNSTYEYKNSSIVKYLDLILGEKEHLNLDIKQLISEVFQIADSLKSHIFRIGENEESKDFYVFSGGQMIKQEKIGGLILNLDENLVSFFEKQANIQNAPFSYNNKIVHLANNGGYYLIENNLRRFIVKDLIVLKEFKDKKIIEINLKNLLNFSEGESVAVPDNYLLKKINDYKFYLSQNNILRPILYSSILDEYKKDKKLTIIEINPTSFNYFKIGEPMFFASGTLIKSNSNNNVYLIDGNKRRYVASNKILLNNGYKLENLKSLTDEEMNSIPLGENLFYKDGSLVSLKDDYKTYYLFKDYKFWIKDLDTFVKLGFKIKDVIGVNESDLALYKNGGAIDNFKNFQDAIKLIDYIKSPKISNNPKIKILLKEYNFSESLLEGGLMIRASNDFYLSDNRGKILERFLVKDEFKMSWELIFKKYGPIINLKSDDKDNIFEVTSFNNFSNDKEPINYNKFRGSIVIKNISLNSENALETNRNLILFINEVNLEDYIKGIEEILNDDNIEFLKAISVVIRSHIVFKIFSDKNANAEILYDFRADGDSIVYRGYNYEKKYPKFSEVSLMTYGTILSYDDKPALVYFSLDSGGMTLDSRNVLGQESQNYPYLWGGVKDPPSTRHNATEVEKSVKIGLSLEGAKEMASLGLSFSEILARYYKGTTLIRIY